MIDLFIHFSLSTNPTLVPFKHRGHTVIVIFEESLLKKKFLSYVNKYALSVQLSLFSCHLVTSKLSCMKISKTSHPPPPLSAPCNSAPVPHPCLSSFCYLYTGDQLVDINGIELTGRSVAEISEIIRSSPEQVACTVKLSTDFRVVDTHAAPRADYAEIDLSSLKPRDDSESESDESDHENKQPSAENVNGNVETTENNKNLSQEVKYEEPQYDNVNIRRRHSSPLRHEPEEPNPLGEQKPVEDVQYLELNFPTYDRPRLKSDPTKKPPKTDKKPVAPIAAYAYIELDFKDKQLTEFTKMNVESVNEEQKNHSVLPKWFILFQN